MIPKIIMLKSNTYNINDDQTLTLPSHILIDEILPRLPVKSLLRFKLVSKHWNYVISSYTFAKMHLKLSSCSRDNFIVFNRMSEIFWSVRPPFYLLPQNEHSSMNQLIGVNVEINAIWPLYVLVGCCDGLLCFEYQTGNSSSFRIWNPATHEVRDVGNPDGVNHTWANGFGYVSSIHDYKIVSSFGMKGSDNWSGFYEFSLREAKWKRIGPLDEEVAKRMPLHNTVWIDGIVFWTYKTRSSDIEFDYDIIRLNSVTEELNVYSMTTWLNDGFDNMSLHRLKGCLALVRSKRDGTCNFWTLKKQDDWSSWEELFAVNFNNIAFIGLFDHGKCLVRHYAHLRLVDLSETALECVQEEFDYESLNFKFYPRAIVATYTPSLVSPFQTTKSDGEDTKMYEIW